MRIYTDIITCIYKKLSSLKPSPNASPMRGQLFLFFTERHFSRTSAPWRINQKSFLYDAQAGENSRSGQVQAKGTDKGRRSTDCKIWLDDKNRPSIRGQLTKSQN